MFHVQGVCNRVFVNQCKYRGWFAVIICMCVCIASCFDTDRRTNNCHSCCTGPVYRVFDYGTTTDTINCISSLMNSFQRKREMIVLVITDRAAMPLKSVA